MALIVSIRFNVNIASHRFRIALPISMMNYFDVSKLSSIKQLKELLAKKKFGYRHSYRLLIASKPFSLYTFLLLLIAKYVCKPVATIIDVSDVPVASWKSLSQLIKYVLFRLALMKATVLTCPTSRIQALLSKYHNNVAIICDKVDESLVNLDKEDRINLDVTGKIELLWFGTSGALTNTGRFIPSKSILMLANLLRNEAIGQNKNYNLSICTNNLSRISLLIKDLMINVSFHSWSESEFLGLARKSHICLITFGCDDASKSKSPNRAITSLLNRLPCIVLNPPDSYISLSKTLESINLSHCVFQAFNDHDVSKHIRYISNNDGKIKVELELAIKYIRTQQSLLYDQWRHLLLSF